MQQHPWVLFQGVSLVILILLSLKRFITSTKEVTLSRLSVSRLVGLFAGFCKDCYMDFSKTQWEDVEGVIEVCFFKFLHSLLWGRNCELNGPS